MGSSLRLVLLGPPGAGKGTQAQLLKEQLNIPHISSGDLFRYHLREKTELGQQAAQYMNQGLLVPDEITIGIILDKVLDLPTEEGFLLDGFPRTSEQAKALEETLSNESRQLDWVVSINVEEAELIKRLRGRYTCRNCQRVYTISEGNTTSCSNCGGELYQREDDRPETVKQRLQVYQQETAPLIDFYRQRDLLVDIPGLGAVNEVNQRILSALGQPTARAD